MEKIIKGFVLLRKEDKGDYFEVLKFCPKKKKLEKEKDTEDIILPAEVKIINN